MTVTNQICQLNAVIKKQSYSIDNINKQVKKQNRGVNQYNCEFVNAFVYLILTT